MKHDRIVSLRKNSLTSLAFLSHSLRLTPLPPSSAGRWFLSRFAISVGTPLQTTQPERGAIYSGQLSLSLTTLSLPRSISKRPSKARLRTNTKSARGIFFVVFIVVVVVRYFLTQTIIGPGWSRSVEFFFFSSSGKLQKNSNRD